MKYLLLLFTGIVFLQQASAQTAVRLRFTNQYEAPIDKVNVSFDGAATAITTDKLGFAQVTVPPGADSMRVASEHYELKTFAVADLKPDTTLVVKKEFTWRDLLNPMFYIVYGGLWLLLFIVFAETGLFAGFFLPGDSLLFVAGIYSANLAKEFLKIFGLAAVGNEFLELLVLVALVSFAGILGNTVGYWFGRRIGPAMFNWKDNLFFKQRYLYQAKEFYDKNGGGAIIFARFLPIVRTFAPIIAGIVGMDKKRFAFFNIVGCIAWVVSMIFAGHFLQIWVKRQFGFELKDHLEMIIIIIILVTTAPVLWKLIFGGKKKTVATDN